LRDQLLGLGAEDGTDALRADLDDATGGFAGFDHFEAVGGRMRHGLFAINVFSGVNCIHDNLFVPVVRNRRDQAIDFFVVEEIFVTARSEEIGIASDFAGKRVAAVV